MAVSERSRHENRLLMRKLLVITAGMFCFGFALVPLYEKICEVTGIRNILRPDHQLPANTQIDRDRNVTVEFDSNTQRLAWNFRPLQSHVDVHPGELIQVIYEIHNRQDRPVTGQAIPSYGPQIAAQYFRKVECFCFDRQTLEPGETRQMPIVFVVDPALPRTINTITLSFTFFEVEGGTQKRSES